MDYEVEAEVSGRQISTSSASDASAVQIRIRWK